MLTANRHVLSITPLQKTAFIMFFVTLQTFDTKGITFNALTFTSHYKQNLHLPHSSASLVLIGFWKVPPGESGVRGAGVTARDFW